MRELACMFMETKKSQDLPPINWTPREVGGLAHSESKGLRTRKADRLNASLKTKTMRWHIPSRSEAGKRYGFLLLPFVWFQPSTGWMISIRIGEGHLLYWGHQFKCSPFPETSSQTHPVTVKLTCKLIITVSYLLALQGEWALELRPGRLWYWLSNFT